VHEDTERIVVEVVNKDSGEVIRQIPPEYILDIMAKIDALLGVFVDEKA
jgi:flagellar protein FlaG